MTMDKSLRARAGLMRSRSVLTRAERIERLRATDRWVEGDSPMGLDKVSNHRLRISQKQETLQ